MATSTNDRKASLSVHEDADAVSTLGSAEERLMQLTAESPVFWKNRNLLFLYLLMIPGCIVPSVTLGFDSAMMNGLQAVPSWDACE